MERETDFFNDESNDELWEAFYEEERKERRRILPYLKELFELGQTKIEVEDNPYMPF